MCRSTPQLPACGRVPNLIRVRTIRVRVEKVFPDIVRVRTATDARLTGLDLLCPVMDVSDEVIAPVDEPNFVRRPNLLQCGGAFRLRHDEQAKERAESYRDFDAGETVMVELLETGKGTTAEEHTGTVSMVGGRGIATGGGSNSTTASPNSMAPISWNSGWRVTNLRTGALMCIPHRPSLSRMDPRC